jgi:uncharacterized protein (DUF1684 family)
MTRRLGALAVAGLALSLGAAGRAASQDYETEVGKFRRDREVALRSEGGWLSVVGLHWLKEGSNRVGTAAGSEVQLPAGSAPSQLAVIERSGQVMTVRATASAAAAGSAQLLRCPSKQAALRASDECSAVPAAPAAAVALRPDDSGSPDFLSFGRLTMLMIRRGDLLGARLWDKEAPARRSFKGLTWYSIQSSQRIKARFVPHATPKKIPIANFIGQTEQMTSPGTVEFTMGGQKVSLEPVLEDPSSKSLFFVFKDQTAGKGTYGGGRLLYADQAQGGEVVLDFNRAVSPPCAFTVHATCPLPPPQNRLPVAVEAGEKDPGIHQ